MQPDYSWAVKDVRIDTAIDDHPVTATLEDTGGNWDETRIVHAQYVVGRDGARSTVRQAFGGKLQGDAAHQA